MSGLTVTRRRLPDGKRERIDQAGKLAEEFPDADTLAGEILARIRPQQRTRHQIWYPEISGQEPLMWLKETFEQLNNGRHPEFALPKRIDIVVPQNLLGEGPLSICLVDTKGIDATTERADLAAYFNEPGTLMVLCSSFNDTPSTEVQELLSNAKGSLVSDFEAKAAILSLPRSDEALAVKDDQGIPAESVSEGYDRSKVNKRSCDSNPKTCLTRISSFLTRAKTIRKTSPIFCCNRLKRSDKGSVRNSKETSLELLSLWRTLMKHTYRRPINRLRVPFGTGWRIARKLACFMDG